MNRPRQAAIVLALAERLHQHGSWCGETHLQKATYFLKTLARVPLDYEFVLYKHGPYSFDLREELSALRADGLLDLETRPYPYGPTLAVTEDGRELEHRYSTTLQSHLNRVEFVAVRLGDKRVGELERLATALYVRQTEPTLTAEQAARRVTEYKPHVNLDDANDAVGTVKRFAKEAANLQLVGSS